jgi:hypothetical protein
MSKRRRHASRWLGWIAALALASPALADDQSQPAAPSAEQRQRMAEVHQKMADCLKSNRPFADCRAEMHQACRGMMGEAACPMMGQGGGGMGPGMMGHGKGMGPGMMGGPAQGQPAPSAPAPETDKK